MFAKVIAGTSFVIIILLTVWLIIRDNYIDEQCHAQIQKLTDELNAIEENKLSEEVKLTSRLNSMSNDVLTISKLYLSRDTLSNNLETQNIIVKNVDAGTIGSHNFEVTGHASMKNEIQYASVDNQIMVPRQGRKECILVDA
jgi:hypothetical protein